MQLIKPHHKVSAKVTFWNLKEVVKQAKEVCNFLDTNNESKFKGAWKRAYAISHCQVTEEPFNFFVVSEDLLHKGQKQTRTQNKRNWFFRSKVIFNPRIVEALDKIERVLPKIITKDEGNGKFTREVAGKETKSVSNTLSAIDGCMSYPWCGEKKVERYHTIKVKYQILRSLFGFQWLSTVTEEVEGLKAHIFQHEVDHAYGIDIIRGNGVDKNPVRPYANIGA